MVSYGPLLAEEQIVNGNRVGRVVDVCITSASTLEKHNIPPFPSMGWVDGRPWVAKLIK